MSMRWSLQGARWRKLEKEGAGGKRRMRPQASELERVLTHALRKHQCSFSQEENPAGEGVVFRLKGRLSPTLQTHARNELPRNTVS